MRIAALLLLTLSTYAADLPPGCDARLFKQVEEKNPDRYMVRGDRCEGLYLQPVSGTFGSLLVASLTAIGLGPQWKSPTPLEWRPYAKDTVHVQAFPLRPRIYYRLDREQPGGAGNYTWPTDIVRKYLSAADIGVVAWSEPVLEGHRQRIYLPVSVGPGVAKVYHLVVVSPVDLREVYLTIGAMGEKSPLRLRAALKRGSYAANQRIEIDLPPLPRPGLYRVEISGDRRDAGSVTTPPFLIHHSPR